MGYEDFVNPDPAWGGLIMDFNTVPPSFKKVTTLVLPAPGRHNYYYLLACERPVK